MSDLPGAVLFACTYNTVRSVMAAALMRHFHGRTVFVEDCGLRPGDPDGFAIAAMEEFGLDISAHDSKTFDELEDGSFDLIITLSPEAQHRAVEMTRTMSCDVVFWNTFDATRRRREPRTTLRCVSSGARAAQTPHFTRVSPYGCANRLGGPSIN